ncbi:MAG: hypothetical protein ACOCV1_01640 [Bacillota bacterium]
MIIDKKLLNKTKKEELIDFIMNDLSLSEQEVILKSRKSETDEEYQERLENKLGRESKKKISFYIEKLVYSLEDIYNIK